MKLAASIEEGLQALEGNRGVSAGLLRTQDPAWLLTEEGFTLTREHEIESLFAIANGYVGNRGSLGEGTVLSAPATFVAGVFKQSPAPGAVPELMTVPDWTGLRIWIEGEALSIEHGDVLEHRRVLDFRRGMFWREWRHRDPHGRITRIAAFRLASLADQHLLLHSVTFTPENYSSVVRFESSMEYLEDEVSLLAPDWKTRASSTRPNMLPLIVRVPGRETTVAIGLTTQMFSPANADGKREMRINRQCITECCETRLAVGSECTLHRFASVFSSRETDAPFEAVMRHLAEAVPGGIKPVVSAHASEWQSRWEDADVEVEGNESLQRAIRFAEYHLIGSSNPNDGRVSIGARGLTGAAYKGHVFWDTETYMLPFFIFTHPLSARRLLEYRYHTLEAAREKARKFGFRGAMYPWESADTGEEVTPNVVIAPNGEVLKILNGEMEVHITADIAYGVWQYWQATGDDDFFLQFGAEMVLESARFWASRGALEADGAYHIRHVIGPDEYHENVDDNAYTNLMAAWNLRRGAESAGILQQRWPERWQELSAGLQLSAEEVGAWRRFAEAMFLGFDPQSLLFEQFTGYFHKQQVDLQKYEPRTAAMDVILGHEKIQKTNIVKQADVVLATYLLWDEMTADVRAANFHYYEPRTGHGSSLSPSIHALVAARLGDRDVAQRYLKQASEIDLGNNMGNAAGGVHAAALGGLWQAFVFGFAGFRPQAEEVIFKPAVPPNWRRLTFPLQWRGRKLRVSINSEAIAVTLTAGEPFQLCLEGVSAIQAKPGHEYVAEQTDSGWRPWREPGK